MKDNEKPKRKVVNVTEEQWKFIDKMVHDKKMIGEVVREKGPQALKTDDRTKHIKFTGH